MTSVFGIDELCRVVMIMEKKRGRPGGGLNTTYEALARGKEVTILIVSYEERVLRFMTRNSSANRAELNRRRSHTDRYGAFQLSEGTPIG